MLSGSSVDETGEIQHNINHIFKTYSGGISDRSLDRIASISKLCSDAGISPLLINVSTSENFLALTYEKITPLITEKKTVDISNSVLREQIRLKVAKLHELGICHGNLSLYNIGINNEGEVVIFNFDYSFTDIDTDDDLVKRWLREGYKRGESITVEELREADWNQWLEHTWLKQD
jgi:hypothetical protein